MSFAWEIPVPTYVTLVFIIILLVAFVLIATDRFDKTLVVLVGAAATIAAGKIFSVIYSWVPVANQFISGVPHELLFSDHEVFTEMINWETIFIIVSVTIIAVVVERSGLFEYISIRVVQFSGGDLRKLFLYLCLITLVLCMILGNDPAFILIGALTIVVAHTMEKNPIPYIMGVVIVANTSGVSTAVASFVNILVTSFYGYDPFFFLSYPTFVFLGLPFALITTFIAIAFFLVYFRGDFGKPKDRKTLLEMKAWLEQFDPASVIQNRELFRKTKYLLVATIGGFVVGGVVGVPFYLIALIAAGAFLVADIKEFKSNVMKVDWKLILFFVGIFIIIGGVSSTGVLRSLGETLGYLTQGNSFNTLSVLMMFSGILGGLFDNISVTTTLLYVVPFLSNTALVSERLIIWSLIYGANMGANLTPIGGIPNIIAYSMLEDENIAFGWKKFLKISVPITLITLVCGILMLELFNLVLGWSYFEEMILGMLIPWG